MISKKYLLKELDSLEANVISQRLMIKDLESAVKGLEAKITASSPSSKPSKTTKSSKKKK